MAVASPDFLQGLLKSVSRSFYLTLRAIPRAVRSQIGVAYLLARATDTIADTEIIPIEERLHALRMLRERILDLGQAPLDFTGFAQHQASPAEQTLLQRCEQVLGMLPQFISSDQQLIRNVLEIITSGQELDLKRFAGATVTHIKALQTDQELDDYTYRVAGCVGEFWTQMCHAHLFPRRSLDEAFLMRNGIRFGKGLQMVNILRDLPFDLRQGRCYLPADKLRAVNLTPADLLSSATEPRFRKLYHEYLDGAAAHLAAGWAYTNALPRSCFRLRIACALPLLIGVNTIKKLRAENVLNSAAPIKVSRREVRQMIVRSISYYPFPRAWKKLFPGT